MHKRRISHRIPVTTRLDYFFHAYYGLVDDPAPTPIEEINYHGSRGASSAVLADKQAYMRTPNVDMSVRKVDIVERIHLIAPSSTFRMYLCIVATGHLHSDR